eukprot:2663135-Pyramimonas_sp.AAC.1
MIDDIADNAALALSTQIHAQIEEYKAAGLDVAGITKRWTDQIQTSQKKGAKPADNIGAVYKLCKK